MPEPQVHFLTQAELRKHVKDELAKNPFLAGADTSQPAEEDEAPRRAEEEPERDERANG